MANTFAILTIIALAVSAFFASKNQDEFKRNVETLQIEKSNVVTNQETLRDNTERRDQAIADRRETEEQTVSLREQESAQQSAIETVRGEITSRREESETKAAQIQRIDEQIAEIGEVRELAGKIQRLAEEIAELEDRKIPITARRRDLIAQKSEIDAQIGIYESQNEANRSGKSYFESTRISSVFPTWGFVTLPIGETSGVVTGSTLNVVRGGETVAKLRVRSVESNRSSADVIPDTVADDVTLRAGDRVVPSSESTDATQASN